MSLPNTHPDTLPGKKIDSLKVLTVNTHKGFTFLNRRFILPELRDAVRGAAADVVFLQEVHGAQEHHALRFRNWPRTPHYEFLAETIWPDFAYGRNAVYPHGHHGNALLSKFPIVSHQNLDCSMRDGSEDRGLLHCMLQVPGHAEFHAICVHLGLREAHRRRQLHLLCDLLDTIPADAPVVVAGDFNDWRQRAGPLLRDRARLDEVFQHQHGVVARSYPARWPALRLDRIYVRNVIAHQPQILSRRPWSHLSDHVALAVEVRL